jgi:hypothetical protein
MEKQKTYSSKEKVRAINKKADEKRKVNPLRQIERKLYSCYQLEWNKPFRKYINVKEKARLLHEKYNLESYKDYQLHHLVFQKNYLDNKMYMSLEDFFICNKIDNLLLIPKSLHLKVHSKL